MKKRSKAAISIVLLFAALGVFYGIILSTGLLATRGYDHAVWMMPLNPVSHTFDNGKKRIDYTFINADEKPDRELRDVLYKQLTGMQETQGKDFDVYSVYVYHRTPKLNERYKGGYDDIKEGYASDLEAYARWTNGKMDIFYLVEDGNVVYDGLENKAVDPFEFD